MVPVNRSRQVFRAPGTIIANETPPAGRLPPGNGLFDLAILPAETPFDMALPDPAEGWQ